MKLIVVPLPPLKHATGCIAAITTPQIEADECHPHTPRRRQHPRAALYLDLVRPRQSKRPRNG